MPGEIKVLYYLCLFERGYYNGIRYTDKPALKSFHYLMDEWYTKKHTDMELFQWMTGKLNEETNGR